MIHKIISFQSEGLRANSVIYIDINYLPLDISLFHDFPWNKSELIPYHKILNFFTPCHCQISWTEKSINIKLKTIFPTLLKHSCSLGRKFTFGVWPVPVVFLTSWPQLKEFLRSLSQDLCVGCAGVLYGILPFFCLIQ